MAMQELEHGAAKLRDISRFSYSVNLMRSFIFDSGSQVSDLQDGLKIYVVMALRLMDCPIASTLAVTTVVMYHRCS